MLEILKSISRIVRIPSICAVCRCYHAEGKVVCKPCFLGFEKLLYPCQYCAMPLPDPHYLVCGSCNKTRLAFDNVLTKYAFVEPLRALVHDFKYQHALYLRRFLAGLLLDALDNKPLEADYLVPVPLHATRLVERGFNQSLVLARIVSKKTGIPVHLKLCMRVVATEAQVGLSGEARRANLQDAFRALPCSNMRIILVDDLLTTGSTAHAIATVLKAQGAARVDVLCCARAV